MKMINPYIKISLNIDTEAIEKDVIELKEILKRLSTGLNQEIILIMGDDVIRIDESEKSSN